MKQFDLEKALAGDPVITREGEEALNIFYSKELENNGKELCVIVVLKSGCVLKYRKNGTLNDDYVEGEGLDLFMAQKKQKYYMAIGKEMDGYNYRKTSALYKSKKDLDNWMASGTNFYSIKELELDVE